MKGPGMMNLWCLGGYGAIHPWYETAAELLSVMRGKGYLWNSRKVGLLAPLTAFGYTD